MAALPTSLTTTLEGKISHAVKKKIGINFYLSKAIIFSATEHGGLGLISPVDAFYVEIVANAIRFVNSSAPLTREVSRFCLQQAAYYISPDLDIVTAPTTLSLVSLALIPSTELLCNPFPAMAMIIPL